MACEDRGYQRLALLQQVYKGQLKGEDVAVKVWPLAEGMQEQAEVSSLKICGSSRQ